MINGSNRWFEEDAAARCFRMGCAGGMYRDTSLIRKRLPLGTYSSPMHRATVVVLGGGRFLMSEVRLCMSG